MRMGRLDRWVSVRFAWAAAVVATALVGLYIIGDVSQHLDDLPRSAGQRGWGHTAYLLSGYYSMGIARYLFEFPELVFAGAAAAVLVGILRNGEAAAVQGMGRSLRRFVLPIIVMAAAFGVLQLAASEFVVPRAIMLEEAFRAELLGGRAMSGVVFPAEGADAVVGVGYAGEEGHVSDMVVIERLDKGFRFIQVEKAGWDSSGRIRPLADPRVLAQTEGAPQPGNRLEELNAAPAAALKLRLLSPAALRFGELAALGGGRMLAELGSRLGALPLLTGTVLAVIALLAKTGDKPTAGRGVAAFLLVELAVRLADTASVGAGAASTGIAAVLLGMSAGIAVLGVGLALFVRMPT
ncbi:MAG: LptF/LptG family permease [Planctomycetes bacterium]|nr:LptF/LptG family permease [Planctomycetota bacterium]